MACGTAYHGGCLQAGKPFRTRLLNNKGLVWPRKASRLFPNFVCEACQVRAQVGRELRRTPHDIHLLQFERMRIIDSANKWAYGTMTKYGSQIGYTQGFENMYEVSILRARRLKHPPLTPAIPLAWAMYKYSLKDSTGTPKSFGAIRGIRSAVHFYYAWDTQLYFSERTILDSNQRCAVVPYASPAQEYCTSMAQGGMARRMGTSTRPSWALRHKHIRYIDHELDQAYRRAPTLDSRHEIACAGVANLILALGGLRATENFNAPFDGAMSVPPTHGAYYGLPLGIGFVAVNFALETKTNVVKNSDLILSYYTASGFAPGMWMDRLLEFEPFDGQHLYSTRAHPRWTSKIFRTEYAYPILEEMRRGGEPTLMAFSDLPGERICDRMYSCNSWRRFLASFLRRFHPGLNKRAATKDEIYMHQRWEGEHKNRRVSIDVHYLEFNLEERICVTYFCV